MNINTKYSCVGFNDLPDEVLMIIFKNLNNFEVLYSLQDVNQRLNKLVQDSTFTSRLTFVKWCSDNFIDVLRCDMMLNRFCLQILPKIHDKIKWLDLESSSIKNVLRTAVYPNLYGLGLYNIDEESARCLFTVQCFDDCLYLLDGRFNQLHTLCVDLVHINEPHEIKNQGNLPNLKCFSLSCNLGTNNYDELILPLLHRMSNLEQLGLYIATTINTTFIDGNHLKKNIFNRMSRLNQFKFYIRSFMLICNQVNLPSTEDIQRTFIDFPNNNNNIISYVDYFSEAKESQCHIYSYPSFMPYYGNITNNFPGGLFKYVRVVSLFDEHPFEHEFFLQIQESFPFMEQLSMANYKSQNHKQSYESNNDNRNLSLIEYSFLGELVILNAHDDYIEQFLCNTKTHLQNNVLLHIKYESLQRVTHNFTREDTRINCAKINELKLYRKTTCSNSSLQEYFPYAKISYPGKF
ncbi:unnamed protein product [Rotaria sp. Silwood1]|nr:unnamed protein product [Rotaria sp. Silwood1]